MATAAERLTAFSSALAFDDIPPEVVETAKLHLLDTLGCGLAAHGLDVACEGRASMADLGGPEEATVIGLGAGLPAANAAFANAMLCHGLDFDDTHSDSVSHVSAVVCPAALAAGEGAASTGRELLAAIVAGNELVTRIGMAASGAFHRRGFHASAICGIFGAAAAACRLQGLDAPTATSALGIAGSMASGIFAYLEDGSSTKRIHPGWAAHGALLASRLAAHGASGPRSVLEGRFGLYHCFVGEEGIDLEPQLGDLGERWETLRIAYKPYPACHFMHGSLGATGEAAAGRTFLADEIEDVVVTAPQAVVQAVLEPVRDKLAPRTDYEAKFSLQYSTAAMLRHGKVGISTYTDEAIADPEVLELARLVKYETPELPTYPQAFPGGVRIRTKDGKLLEAHHAYQRGGPENPLSADEVRAKFRENASLALASPALAALEEAVLGLEKQQELRAAFAPLAHTGVEEVVTP